MYRGGVSDSDFKRRTTSDSSPAKGRHSAPGASWARRRRPGLGPRAGPPGRDAESRPAVVLTSQSDWPSWGLTALLVCWNELADRAPARAWPNLKNPGPDRPSRCLGRCRYFKPLDNDERSCHNRSLLLRCVPADAIWRSTNRSTFPWKIDSERNMRYRSAVFEDMDWLQLGRDSALSLRSQLLFRMVEYFHMPRIIFHVLSAVPSRLHQYVSTL